MPIEQAVQLDAVGLLDDFPCAARCEPCEVTHQHPVCRLRIDLAVNEDFFEGIALHARIALTQLLTLDDIQQPRGGRGVFQMQPTQTVGVDACDTQRALCRFLGDCSRSTGKAP
ncbi:hypothetical protein GCM10011247_07330 [Pseudomonas plecoglossicida]|nr:hypothetical protein GCM10011247_07330 [Pseudomonas plecoglossicida]